MHVSEMFILRGLLVSVPHGVDRRDNVRVKMNRGVVFDVVVGRGGHRVHFLLLRFRVEVLRVKNVHELATGVDELRYLRLVLYA